MTRNHRFFPWFAALAALSSAAFAACSTGGTDTADGAPDPSPRGENGPGSLARVERWRSAFPRELGDRPSALFERTDAGAAVVSPHVRVEIPSSATGAFGLTDVRSGARIEFALRGAEDAPLSLDRDVAIYPGAARGADVLHRVRPGGTEDFVAFERPLAEPLLEYVVDVRRVAGLRLVDRTLEFLDGRGSPRLRVAPPFVVDARGQRRAANLSVIGCDVSTDPRAPWGRPVTPPGASECAVAVRWDDRDLAYPILVDPAWEATADLVTARSQAGATELDPAATSSLVLVSGGFDSAGIALTSAELYFPLERAFAATSPMAAKRGAHTATRLANGKVLVAGGLPDLFTIPQPSSADTTMEQYDPATGKFTQVPIALSPGRALHTATLLPTGQVLFTGGTTLLGQPTVGAVLFEPAGPGFTALGAMSTARAGHTATLLQSGKVLIAGGFVQAQNAVLSAELWNPTTLAFESIATIGAGNKSQMTKARAFHTATRVDCKTVLIAGGTSKTSGGIVEASAEIWQDDENPAQNDCGPAVPSSVRGFSQQLYTMGASRARHTATLLPEGRVVLVGGTDGVVDLASAEAFSLTPTPSFSPQTGLPALAGRRDHVALLVNAGASEEAGRAVLVGGGAQGATVLSSAFVLAKNLGEGCGKDSECESGFCTDGVCCNVRCDATCVSCAAAEKEDADMANNGTCGPQKAILFDDVAFSSTLPGELPTECNGETESHKFCDGAGNVLVKNFPCEPAACGGNGYCTDFCDCNDASCGVGSSPCAKLGWCDTGTQQCEDKYPNGVMCADGYQCLSGFCVDGVCCGTACDDVLGSPCEACNVSGKLGVCSLIGSAEAPEQPHPNTDGTFQRPECGGDGDCRGACSGAKTCSFPTPADTLKSQLCVACPEGAADCAAGEIVVERYLCDGKGSYTTDRALHCGDNGLLKCDGDPGTATACLAKCAVDEDCLEDAFCDAVGACNALPVTGRCDADDKILRLPSGADQECAPYLCGTSADTGVSACRTECQKKDDCQGDLFCDTSQHCVDKVPEHVDAPMCSAAPGREGGRSPLFAVGALFALVAARAWGRRRPAR